MDCQYIFLPLNEHYFIIQNILEHVSKLNNKRFIICELDCFLWKIIYYRNMSENKEEIGARIRLARKAAKLTQKELGKILGVGNKAVCMYETGMNNATTTSLAKIAKVTGRSLEWFITGNELSAEELAKLSIVSEPETGYSPEIERVLNIMKFNPKAYTLATSIIPGLDELPDDLQSEAVRKIFGVVNEAEEKAKQRAVGQPAPDNHFR